MEAKATDAVTAMPKPKPKRHHLLDFPPSFWHAITTTAGNQLSPTDDAPTPAENGTPAAQTTAQTAHHPTTEPTPTELTVSQKSQCTTCNIAFKSFEPQRDHFQTDWHKYNVQKRTRNRHPVSEDDFDQLSDLGSHSSLSGTDEASDVDQDAVSTETRGTNVVTATRFAERIEFSHPSKEGYFIVVYKAALPDLCSLASLASRGSWVVLMTGGGHFSAALWNSAGVMQRHKTFHRYTSRKKQGGSQAAADEARGAGSRIKSAGATLRRYGEQALEKEVHDLLNSWQDELCTAQCIFIRASQREKRDLLYGWTGSPLKQPLEDGRTRNIPIPTRRATLKETVRVYDELTTVVISPTSLVETTVLKQAAQPPAKPKPTAAGKRPASVETKEKGTDHLKKREEKKVAVPTESAPVVEQLPPLDTALVQLVSLCLADDREELARRLAQDESCASAVFSKRFFADDDERFANMEQPVGLIGVAALICNTELMEWLMNAGIDPTVGASPYLLTKHKAVRTSLRTYWASHPDRFDYVQAGIPSPLTRAEIDKQDDRNKRKRQKDRRKKKEKDLDRIEQAKPPEQKARELRAAAAEARLLGNRCANCHKSLVGLTAFERLAYKYCSTQCVNAHRLKLNAS